MSIKLLLLKSGEEVIADVQEMVAEDKTKFKTKQLSGNGFILVQRSPDTTIL